MKKNITIFHLKISIFTNMKNHSILHGCVFVMFCIVKVQLKVYDDNNLLTIEEVVV